MKKNTLVGLCLCYLVGFTIGNGFLPLMPLYAQRLGATKEMAGYYLAFAFLCVAAGSLLAGRLSDLTRHRRSLLAATGAGLMPFTWFVGRAATVTQLALANGAQWFLGGMTLGITAAIAGRQAGEHERGKLFGVLGVMISLGTLLGGLTFGRMVDMWGYRGMSNVAALFSAITPAAALFLVRGREEAVATAQQKPLPGAVRWAGAAFFLLLAVEILGNSPTGPGNMGRSLSMDEHGFNGAAITATMAVGGVISLPFPFLLGRLSDAVGRKSVLIASFLAGTACLLLLVVAQALWQFWAAAALMSVHAISTTVGPAYVADVVRRDKVGTGITLFQSSAWVGTVVGMIYAGIAFQHAGLRIGLAVGSLFSFAAALILLFMKSPEGSRRPGKRTLAGARRAPAATRQTPAGYP